MPLLQRDARPSGVAVMGRERLIRLQSVSAALNPY